MSNHGPFGRQRHQHLKELQLRIAGEADFAERARTMDTRCLVLSESRQIVWASRQLKDWLGIPHSFNLLGMRPGEAMACIHALDDLEGCGCGPACAQCGLHSLLKQRFSTFEAFKGAAMLSLTRPDAVRTENLCLQTCLFSFEGHQLCLVEFHPPVKAPEARES